MALMLLDKWFFFPSCPHPPGGKSCIWKYNPRLSGTISVPTRKCLFHRKKTKSSSSNTSIETWLYINYWLFVIQKKVQNWALLLLVLLLVAVGDGKYNKNSVFDLEYWTSDFMFYIKIFQMKILALCRWRRFQQIFHPSSIQANIAAINFLERPHKS